jgi:hypothetical protein
VTYWPRRTGFRWWSAFDRGEARDELAHIAAMGFNSVRFCLRWEDFQVAPQRMNSATLRAFEQALDAAAEARLQVHVALFPVAIGGALHLPRWASRPDPVEELQRLARFGRPLVVQQAALPPIIYAWGYHDNEAPDLFDDQPTQKAQRYFIREAVSYFGGHPAIAGWQLGEGMERAHRPATASIVQSWYGAMSDAVRAERSKTQVLGVTSERGLLTPTGPRPEHLAATCDVAGISVGSTLPLSDQKPIDVDALLFRYALASSLAGARLAVVNLGQATASDNQSGWVADTRYGRAAHSYLANQEQQAAFLGAALEQLRNAGAQGVWLAAYADYAPDLWRTAPLDQSVRERMLGLVTSDGREKTAVQTVREFVSTLKGTGKREQGIGEQDGGRTTNDQRPTTNEGGRETEGGAIEGKETGKEESTDNEQRTTDNKPQTNDRLDVDVERYWRDPQRECERLWREFMRER